MRRVLFLAMLASALAGCATHARTTSEGSALPREATLDPAIEELRPDPQHDPARSWSIRDFIQPRGLLR